MRALIFDGDVRVVEAPLPARGEGEALIKVLSAGICNTDLEIVRGYMGFRGILGHEFVGIVEESSNASWLGKRVVGEINCVCRQCHYCQMEMPHHCMNRSVLGIQGRNGAFAEYLVLPEENLHAAPGSIRDDVAVFVEPLAAAFRIPEQIGIQATDRVVVLGDGKLGQLTAQALWIYTKNLVCTGRHDWKLALLQERGIATAYDTDPLERGADLVVEATGKPAGLRRALELIRPEGTIVLKSTLAQPVAVDMSVPVINEVKLIGSRCGPFRPALEALAQGSVDVRPLITETYPLRDGVEALRRAESADVLKVILHI